MHDHAANDISTRCVHAGDQGDPEGSPIPPVYTTSTFTFETTADMLAVVSGERQGNLYTRYGFNPTITRLEDKLAAIEGAESALAFGSGMAALSATFITHGRSPAGVICVGEAYGGTMELLHSQLPQLGITSTFLLGHEADTLPAVLASRPGPAVVFLESPTNPRLEIIDIGAMAAVAHEHGALVVVDNTFASPVLQQPLALGADLVVHSATKYLGGHCDLTAGALMGSELFVRPVWNWRKNLGQAPSPELAAQLARSIRSMVPRVRQQSANALVVARAMRNHSLVTRVMYPGLEDHPNHELAARQMRDGFGGMLAIEVAGTGEEASRVVDALRIFGIAPSLGGVDSLALQPAKCTHYWIGERERAKRGIGDNLVRLSIGLEDPVELIADLDQALRAGLGAPADTEMPTAQA